MRITKAKKTLYLLIIFSLLIFKSTYCYAKENIDKTENNDPIILTKENQHYNDVSLFLAGLDLPEKSKLYKLTKEKQYKIYKEVLNKKWKKFIDSNINKIKIWRNKFLPGIYSNKVFYPFSGPDLLYPLTFFPRGKDFVMFGLESAGQIPDPLSLTKYRSHGNLKRVLNALGFIMGHSFFITNNMTKKLGRSSYSGITGIMMLFLSRCGYTVANVEKIWLNKKGELLRKPVKNKWRYVSGVEIIFYKNKKNLKRARFFSLNIADRSKKLSYFLSFIKKHKKFSTIIKSASYLMQSKTFSKIRNSILRSSNSILQDDSGIPFRFIKKSSWDISYHGYYHKPIPVFKHHLQKKLQRKINKNTTGKLPFSYGYGYGYRDITYHLIYAVKRKNKK